MFRERIAMVGILRLGLPARKRTSMPRSGGQGTEMTRYRVDKVQRGQGTEMTRYRELESHGAELVSSHRPTSMRERGSRKSRSASPIKLNDSTASMTASAGNNTRWGASNKCARPSLSIDPQLAVGGGTPSPRKLIVASARIAPAMPIAACTITG